MNFHLQRFTAGHQYYSDATVTNTDASRGAVGTFKPVFGRLLDEGRRFVCYTMERFDTLIPNGVYEYDLYLSPHNKRIVPRLTVDEKGVNISQRYLEIHPANWPFQLKGCAAPGLTIDKATSAVYQSRKAFEIIMKLIGESKGGKITYEYLNEMNA